MSLTNLVEYDIPIGPVGLQTIYVDDIERVVLTLYIAALNIFESFLAYYVLEHIVHRVIMTNTAMFDIFHSFFVAFRLSDVIRLRFGFSPHLYRSYSHYHLASLFYFANQAFIVYL